MVRFKFQFSKQMPYHDLQNFCSKVLHADMHIWEMSKGIETWVNVIVVVRNQEQFELLAEIANDYHCPDTDTLSLTEWHKVE